MSKELKQLYDEVLKRGSKILKCELIDEMYCITVKGEREYMTGPYPYISYVWLGKEDE